MKRDMTLVRKILNWAIDQPNGWINKNPEFEGYSKEVIAYHVHLMEEAGLVQALDDTPLSATSPHGRLRQVTWEGHDFADAAKDDQIWKKASVSILKEGASFSFELLKEWLKSEAKLKLGLP